MQVIYQTKDSEGNLTRKWDVQWTWLPHFIATNPDIIKYVADKMTETYGGKTVTRELQKDMHRSVIDFICEKLLTKGLKSYLLGLDFVVPEEAEDAR